MQYGVYEKNNPLALHSICETKESAERWIRETAPEYIRRNYFMNKALRSSADFVVREYKREKR